MSNQTATVVFKSKLNGEMTAEVQGAPGEQCLGVTDNLSEILGKVGMSVTHQEATDEMHASVGRPPEAHNNV